MADEEIGYRNLEAGKAMNFGPGDLRAPCVMEDAQLILQEKVAVNFISHAIVS